MTGIIDAMLPERFDLDDYRWLVEEGGHRWLEQRCLPAAPINQQADRLRRQLTPTQSGLILQQLDLRRRAARRFARSDQMLFTDLSLQQATDDRLAAYKAQRFEAGQPVVDLGCGVGGDFIALAQRGPTCGIDLDPILVYLARANLRALQLDRAWVSQGDAAKTCILPDAGVHLDPDRRPSGQRSVQIQYHQPGPDLIRKLTSHPAGLALKLAPATDVSDPLLKDAELEWIGRRRQCQQLVAWFGPLARFTNQRVATVMESDGTPHSLMAETIPELPFGASIGRFLVEPYPCVLAAGMASVVASQQQLTAVTAGGGYLTGDRAQPSPWASCFEVLEVMPFRTKHLKIWLRARNIGRLEVKHRGVKLDPSLLIRELRISGEDSATLIVTRQGPRSIAILARRVDRNTTIA